MGLASGRGGGGGGEEGGETEVGVGMLVCVLEGVV